MNAANTPDHLPPFFDMGGTTVAWRWHHHETVRHEVHFSAEGAIDWSVWIGEQLVAHHVVRGVPDRAAAERYIAEMRTTGADAEWANRALYASGYSRLVHTQLRACICEDCRPLAEFLVFFPTSVWNTGAFRTVGAIDTEAVTRDFLARLPRWARAHGLDSILVDALDRDDAPDAAWLLFDGLIDQYIDEGRLIEGPAGGHAWEWADGDRGHRP